MTQPNIYAQNEFYSITFADLKLDHAELQNKHFENCTFVNCSFSEAKFNACKFVDCDFKCCDLSTLDIKNTAFNDVVFIECKIIGINWTQAKWPLVKLNSPLKFYNCNLSYSSFFQLDLKDIIMQECKALDVDFRSGDFSNGNFSLTDFEGSQFVHSKLRAADFTDAINYNINPSENDIRKARFSMPDVVNLLHSFDIEIAGV